MSVQGALAKVRRVVQALQMVVDLATPETFEGTGIDKNRADAISVNAKRALDAATSAEFKLRMEMLALENKPIAYSKDAKPDDPTPMFGEPHPDAVITHIDQHD